MFKSEANEIATNMRELIEKRAGAWSWFKNLFQGEGEGSMGDMLDKSRRLTYDQILQEISAAQTCEQLPLLRQWTKDVPANISQQYGYDTELIGNMLNRQIENKRKQLQQAGKCK